MDTAHRAAMTFAARQVRRAIQAQRRGDRRGTAGHAALALGAGLSVALILSLELLLAVAELVLAGPPAPACRRQAGGEGEQAGSAAARPRGLPEVCDDHGETDRASPGVNALRDALTLAGAGVAWCLVHARGASRHARHGGWLLLGLGLWGGDQAMGHLLALLPTLIPK
jgi:hypothetical protein